MNDTIQLALMLGLVGTVGFASGWISCECHRLIRGLKEDRP